MLGHVFAGGEDRRVYRFTVGDGRQALRRPRLLPARLRPLTESLKAGRPKREASVREAAALEEPEAMDFVLQVLASDKDAEVRKLAARRAGREGPHRRAPQAA